MEDWLKGLLLYWPIVRKWPVANRYVIATTPERGELIRAEGGWHPVDLTAIQVETELAAWLTPRYRGREGLLAIAGSVGLTGPWVVAKDGITKVVSPASLKMRPPHEMTVDEFAADAREVRELLEAYQTGFLQVWSGDRPALDPLAKAAEHRLTVPLSVFANDALARIVGWTSTTMRGPTSGLDYQTGFGWRAPPSLKEYALGRVLALLQDRVPVNRCSLSECGRPFVKTEARKGHEERRWTRPDVKYCSHKCAQRAWYLRKKGEGS